jgi:2-oxoglutarate ferredoxin oxidoreductase subunit alpha
MMLSDGAIGQMMEKVYLSPQVERSSTVPDWATTGKPSTRQRNIITSLDLDPNRQEVFNDKLLAKYNAIRENEVRFEEFQCEDAEYLLVAYGTSARVCQKSVQIAREHGLKVGLLRPITLFPFPTKRIHELAGKVKGMLSVEMSAGQMVEDVQLAVNGLVPVYHFGRMGGIVTTPEEVVESLKSKFIGG